MAELSTTNCVSCARKFVRRDGRLCKRSLNYNLRHRKDVTVIEGLEIMLDTPITVDKSCAFLCELCYGTLCQWYCKRKAAIQLENKFVGFITQHSYLYRYTGSALETNFAKNDYGQTKAHLLEDDHITQEQDTIKTAPPFCRKKKVSESIEPCQSKGGRIPKTSADYAPTSEIDEVLHIADNIKKRASTVLVWPVNDAVSLTSVRDASKKQQTNVSRGFNQIAKLPPSDEFLHISDLSLDVKKELEIDSQDLSQSQDTATPLKCAKGTVQKSPNEEICDVTASVKKNKRLKLVVVQNDVKTALNGSRNIRPFPTSMFHSEAAGQTSIEISTDVKEEMASFCQEKSMTHLLDHSYFGTEPEVRVKVERDADYYSDDNCPVFRCDICQETFDSNSTLVNHNRTEHVADSYKPSESESEAGELWQEVLCGVCNKLFDCSRDLKKHMETTHETLPSFSCDLCEVTLESRVELKTHITTVHLSDTSYLPPAKPLHKCAVCEQTFLSAFKLDEHLSIHITGNRSIIDTRFEVYKSVRVKTPEVKCDTCGKMSSSANFLSYHMCAKARIRRPHRCKICKKKFEELEDLNEHLLRHTSRTCEKCGESFRLRRDWHAHMLKKHKGYECKDCGKMFTNRQKWQQHQLNHNTSRPFKCTDCDRCYRVKYALNFHKTSVHSGLKPYSCKTCGKAFASRWACTSHEQTHGVKNFKCDICGKVFLRRGCLKKHRGLHTGESNAKCKVCGKILSSKSNLNAHMSVHTGSLRRVCHICGRSLADRGSYIEHMRLHTGEKPYVCEICGKTFSKRYTWKLHLLKHTDVKAFICYVCGKTFVNEYCLRAHILWHTRPFCCDVCGKGFSSVYYRNIHVSKVHGNNAPVSTDAAAVSTDAAAVSTEPTAVSIESTAVSTESTAVSTELTAVSIDSVACLAADSAAVSVGAAAVPTEPIAIFTDLVADSATVSTDTVTGSTGAAADSAAVSTDAASIPTGLTAILTDSVAVSTSEVSK